jgi:hypothetical protein
MPGITTYLSILSFYINGLDSPIKRHRLARYIKKIDLTICCLKEMYLTDKNKHQAGHLWLKPVILVSQKTEKRSIMVKVKSANSL